MMSSAIPEASSAAALPRAAAPRAAFAQFLLAATAAAAAALLPLILTPYQTGLATQILIFGLLAMSIDLLAGFAGRTSLAHGAIFGVAAYVVIYAIDQASLSLAVAVALGVGAATALAAVFALLAVRTSGVYFLLLTLALGMIVWGICVRWTGVTGGENGLRGDIRPAFLVPHRNFYWAVLVIAVPLSFAMWRLARSPFGLTLRGIRDSESRMASLGYDVTLHLFIGFTASGFFAGMAGVMYAFFNNFVSPSTVALAQSVEALLMAIVGGIGTLFGAFAGAATIILLQNTFTPLLTALADWIGPLGAFLSPSRIRLLQATLHAYAERWPTVLGLVFIVVMIFAPDGIVGTAMRMKRRWRK
jgi:branched-chain amino acid transport system permease protein